MRANKLETALTRDRLACLAPPDMFFSHVYLYLLDFVVFFGFLGQHSDIDPSKAQSPTSSQAAEAQPTVMKTVSSRMKNLMRDELLINVRKFETQVHIHFTHHTVH